MFNVSHIHPVIVHFPVALIIIGFLIETVSIFNKREKCLSRAGFYLLLVGTLGAAAAWASGHLFTNEPTSGPVMDVFVKHETGALVTLITMTLASAFRIWLESAGKENSGLKWIAYALYMAGCLSVAFTGLMGGTMVYTFMLSI